jgi:cell division protein FtsL
MARSSAAAAAAPGVARPPAKRRKQSSAAAGGRHATTQAPRRPARRTSGPAKGRTAAAGVRSAAATAAQPAALPRRAPAPRTAPRTAPRLAPLPVRLARGRTGALLDRLLRGRACVAIVFALLVGIVFFNVSLLQMNQGIAQTNERATAVEQENAKLRSQLAPLGSSERIQREAVKRGFSLPAAGDVNYIAGDVNDNAKKAADTMTAPGMGTGTASRAAAQMETAPATGATPQTPATPQQSTADCQLPTAANCQLPTANPSPAAAP